MPTIEENLSRLGIELPDTPPAQGNYVPAAIIGDMVHISGQLPTGSNGLPKRFAGEVGKVVDLPDAQAAARQCAIAILSQLNAVLGGRLDRVTRCVRLGGFVQAGAGFSQHPAVINGASDLMVDVLGEAGRHVRCTVGVASLPLDACVEIEASFQIEKDTA
ncbi:RidA family protein [Cucumibacter marinus]|uniref:RidA family protein n=1 Tax=Cucumibacter marinus TaxID=1121252 RepID=UPI000410CC7A|nr:RidA family protein [Cucumibacter marinus]